jgi:electron transfer flavoprotein-quinone oxidoreductase
MFGGGFLYTNRESISLGLVVGIRDLAERQPPIEAPELIEDFKRRPEIARLIAGGETVEYSAHVIAEAGLSGLSRLYGEGVLVTGDAAGFTLNAGLLVRGMEFAIASGVMAARAVKMAKEKNDFSAQSLSAYQRLLEDSFVLKDLRTFRHAPHVLENPRLFTMYPQLACEVFEKMMYIGEQPKAGLFGTAKAGTRGKRFTLLKDLNEFRRL